MNRRLAAAATSVILLVTACGGGSSKPAAKASEGPLVVNGAIDQKQMAAMTARVGALGDRARKAEAARRDQSVARQFWALSGLEAAVGGPAKADAILAALSTSVNAQVAAINAKPAKFKPTGFAAPDTGEAFGAGLFGGMMLLGVGAKAGVDATNDGRTGSQSSDSGITVVAGKDGVRTEFTGTHESGGVELRMKTSSTVQTCPGADGKVELKGLVDAWASVKGGRDGSRSTVDVTVQGQVDDNAKLTMTGIAYRTQYSKTTGSAGAFVDATVGFGGQATLNRTGGTVSDKFAGEAVALGQLVSLVAAVSLTDAAQSGLESGRCVDLQTSVSDGPSGLDPKASVTITASPKSKLDGAKAGGTVTAKLTGGAASVEPGSKVPADATFTYTAPGEKDKSGTVALESRSRRGVGKASITFDTNAQRAFAADGTAGEFHGTGTICDLEKPFTISGSGLRMSFSPSSAARGSYALSGNAGGVPWSGGGTYTVRLSGDGKSGSLAIKGTNTIHSPLGAFSDRGDMSFTLTATKCGG